MKRIKVFCAHRYAWLSRQLRSGVLVPLGIALTASAALANTDGLALQGEGTLRWFGFKIYEARLFAAKPVHGQQVLDTAFALELTYARDFSGASIAETSADEIKRLNAASAAQHQRWLAAMQKLFPNVKSGDRIRGVHEPGRGASFFYNGQPIGTVADPEFSRAFFSIWLDPKTVTPDLRRQLLGLTGSN